MVNKITKKAILKIKETVDAYSKEMAVIEEKITNIDEKYKKLAEKETQELRNAYESLQSEQEIWNTSLSSYDDSVVNEVLGESSSSDESESFIDTTSTEKEEETKVVDTLFDENNEPENTEVSESVEEPVQFESDTTQKDGSAETSEEWIGNINEEPVEEGTTEEVEESVLDTEDEWPAMPEEWK